MPMSYLLIYENAMGKAVLVTMGNFKKLNRPLAWFRKKCQSLHRNQAKDKDSIISIIQSSLMALVQVSSLPQKSLQKA